MPGGLHRGGFRPGSLIDAVRSGQRAGTANGTTPTASTIVTATTTAVRFRDGAFQTKLRRHGNGLDRSDATTRTTAHSVTAAPKTIRSAIQIDRIAPHLLHINQQGGKIKSATPGVRRIRQLDTS